jgi:hypothetical protein
MSAAHAAEPDETIRDALATLDQVIAEAAVYGDPIRHPLMALRVHLRAQQRLFVDGTLALRQQIEAAKQPLNDADLQRLVQAAARGAERQAGELVRAASWRTFVLAVAGVVVFGVVCTAGGWLWARSSASIAVAGIERRLTGPAAAQWRMLIELNDIGQVARTCAPQGGRTACTYAFWTGEAEAALPSQK